MSTENHDDDQNTDDFVPPKDGSWVPRERMNEAVGKAVAPLQQRVEQLIASQAQLEQQIQTQETAPKKDEVVYTLAELRTAVADEKISQAQADAIYDQQSQKSIKSQVDSSIKAHLDQSDAKRLVDDQLNEYMKLLPDLLKEGSDARTKVATEYNRLATTFGMPVAKSVDDTKLQVAACQVAFGEIEQLRQAKARDVTNENRDTHQEFDGNGQDQSTEGDQKVMKKLDSRQRKYYQGMIDKKFYKDWKEVDEELKFAKR